MRRSAAAFLVGVVGVAGCVSKAAAGPGAQSPERQSEAEYDLARDYFYKGEPRVALDHALKACELNDENAKALYFASTVYLFFCSTEQGFGSPDCRVADAETYARKALKVDESFRDARNLLGQILILEKKYKESIQVLEPLTKDPAYAANYLAWGNLGWAQVLEGNTEGGIRSLKNAVTQPRFCVGYYRLGLAYEKRGDLGQAESNLTSALQVDSPDCQNLQDAWEARARIRLKMGKVTDARSDLEKCREISAQSAIGRQCLQLLAQNAPAPTSFPSTSPSSTPPSSAP